MIGTSEQAPTLFLTGFFSQSPEFCLSGKRCSNFSLFPHSRPRFSIKVSTAMILSHGVCSRNWTFALGVFVFLLLLHQLQDQYSLVPKAAHSFSHGAEAALHNLREDFPLEDFPKRIWTTAPLSPMRIKKDDTDHMRTWMDRNPEHRYELLTDEGLRPTSRITSRTRAG